MTAPGSPPLRDLAENDPASASPDLLRSMVKAFADALMSAEPTLSATRSTGRSTRNTPTTATGYRTRERATRAGTDELAVPKLRHPRGNFIPPSRIRLG
ncbi:transposase [Streptomyces sp. SCSIO 30461]|uniref:transposase n=1 Tax=Streptomyces sp. SCSIO 30461 TaxID=3118085 RepID=UPI0030D3DBF5